MGFCGVFFGVFVCCFAFCACSFVCLAFLVGWLVDRLGFFALKFETNKQEGELM